MSSVSRIEFSRKVRAAIIARAAGKEPRAKSQNFKWLESIAASDWPEACIEWPHAKRPSGYGTIFWRGVRTTSHRVSCELAHGPAPAAKMQAAHSCGNRSCVNPAHLSWKTVRDNAGDRQKDGTQVRGSSIPWSKLSEPEVFIIKGYLAHGARISDLARCYRVGESTIGDIAAGRTWRHV